MSQGYYKRRRGAVEHIEAGTVDLLENGIHDYLSLRANLVIGNGHRLPAGIVSTSAPAIHAYCQRVSERTIQRLLNHLEEVGWLKFSPWRTPGKRGNYMVLICRASVHDMSGNEYRVNGEKTTDWRHPVYEPVGDVSGSCPPSVGDVSGYREVRSKNREVKPRAAKAAAPPDSRFQPIVDSYVEGTKKAGIAPTCDKSDFGSLVAWLKANSSRSLDSVLVSLRHALASTDQHPLRPGFRLREFLQHEAKYQRGPLLKPGLKPQRAVEVTSEEATRKLQDYGVKGLECQTIPSL